MRVIHSFKVFVWAEEHHTVVMSNVGLQTFEEFNTIVESGIRRIQFKRLIGLDNGGLPPTIVNIVVNLKHVVSRNTSESILMVSTRLRLKVFPLDDGKISTL